MALAVQVVIDCADPAALAPFWAELLGYTLQDPPEGYTTWPEFLAAQGVPEEQWNSANAIIDPEGRGPRIYFQRVPESKIIKNRVHLDVQVSGGHKVALEERRVQVDSAVERVTELGAKRLRAHEENGHYWVVMEDPEGNEFCLH